MNADHLKIFILIILFQLGFPTLSVAADNAEKTKSSIELVVRSLMKQYGIPGMAIGLVQNGTTSVYNFGVMSKDQPRPVDGATLFEVGSISKTLTVTLASVAVEKGHLSWSDKVSKFIPSLKNSDFAGVSLLNLGTHTAGELPLQVPEEIADVNSLIPYYQTWKTSYPPGTRRSYSNISIGLLGFITAQSQGKDFEVLMKELIFSKLYLKNTFLTVPEKQLSNYAQGYNEKDIPRRMSPGVFDKEAYGIRTTASDLLQLLKANMQLLQLDADIADALRETHRPYYQVEPMTQDLIWEQYPYPVTRSDLLAGNSKNAKVYPAVKIAPPNEPKKDVWINKTGSTGGFSAYVAFVPAKKMGIVLLANKSVPISARVAAAYEILEKLK